MANTLGSVVIEMAVNLARLRSDFGTAAQISQTRLREIERNASRTVREISNVGRAVQSAFGAIGISVGLATIVTGLKNAAMAAIEFGDEMAKASAKTGVAGSAFSELAFAAKMSDVDLQALTKSFIRLQKATSEAASGSKSALQTFQALGISINEFRKLSPDRQFEVVAEQLSRLSDQTDRTRAGTELLGRGYEQLAPLLEQGAAGIRALREEAVRTGKALSEDQIAKLADADQAIKQLSSSWESFARTMTALVSPSLVRVLETLESLSRVKPSDYVSTLLNKGPFATYGDLAKTAQDRVNRESVQQQLNPPGGLSPELMRRSVANLPTAAAAPPGFRAESKRVAEEDLQDLVIYTRRMFDLRTEQEKLLNELSSDFYEGISRDITAMVNTTDEAAEKMAENLRQKSDVMSEFALEAARNMQDAFADFLFDPFEQGLQGMLSGFIDIIRRMVAEFAASQLFSFLGGALSGSTNPLLAGLGSFFMGGKAAGGPVTAGGAYLVGEKGPELFMPRSSGTIVPNGGFGGGVNVSYSIDARGADAERIMAILPAMLRQTEQRTVATVLQMQRQGRFA